MLQPVRAAGDRGADRFSLCGGGGRGGAGAMAPAGGPDRPLGCRTALERRTALKRRTARGYRTALVPSGTRAVAVGVTGFEPATSSSRTTRATKLRHTPRCGHSVPGATPEVYPMFGGAHDHAVPAGRVAVQLRRGGSSRASSPCRAAGRGPRGPVRGSRTRKRQNGAAVPRTSVAFGQWTTTRTTPRRRRRVPERVRGNAEAQRDVSARRQPRAVRVTTTASGRTANRIGA